MVWLAEPHICVGKPQKGEERMGKASDIFWHKVFLQLNKVVALSRREASVGKKSCHKHDVRSVMYTFLCIFHVCDILSPSIHSKRIISCAWFPSKKFQTRTTFRGDHAALSSRGERKITSKKNNSQSIIMNFHSNENFSYYRDADLSDFDFVSDEIQLMKDF